MSQLPTGETILGTITSATLIAPDIYEISATDEDGAEHTGVMAQRDSDLSYRAARMAREDGDWLCFDEGTRDIPIYEVLRHRVRACKRLEAASIKEMGEIRRDGKLTLTSYFGECAPPLNTPDWAVEQLSKVRNGIFFTRGREGLQLAVHEAIAEGYMSPMAAEFGAREGDYLFYDTTTCVVPLNELKNVFEEAEALITSKNSLYALLNNNFPAYTAQYNSIIQEKYKIPGAGMLDGDAGFFKEP